MEKATNIQLFETKQIRASWSEEDPKWYFSIVDVIEALTGTDRPRKYWNALKTKLSAEGSELSHKLGQLKMLAEDGKMRDTDVADTEQLLRLIQSVPSPKNHRDFIKKCKDWASYLIETQVISIL